MSLFQFGFQRTSCSSSGSFDPGQHAFVPDHMPAIEESGLGIVEYQSALSTVSDVADPTPTKKRRLLGTYIQYSPKDRAKIGQYALEHGNERARCPHLKESTIRNFKKAYKERLDHERKKLHPKPVLEIQTQPRGRPPLLLELDGKLITFLKAVRIRGGVINIHVVRAAAKALIETNADVEHQLRKFDMPRSSIYRRMGLTRRMGTTSRPPLPQGLYDECRWQFLQQIDQKRREYAIPAELVLNSDQTPSSYVSVGRSTMASHGSKSVPIKGLSDKRNITLNFVITLSGEILPLQIIYGGKTKANLPRGFAFPTGFCLTQNPKHWSNEAEPIKLIDQVIYPYTVKKQAELHLPETQKALLVWDVFKGQMTAGVKDKLKSLNFELVAVPANMTHFFQPLDLMVNGPAKKFVRHQFTEYYSNSVKQQLDSGKQLDDIDVDFRLTTIKPLHAQWLVDMYNHFTTSKGIEIIVKGWKKSGIAGLFDGSTVLPPEDPFLECY